MDHQERAPEETATEKHGPYIPRRRFVKAIAVGSAAAVAGPTLARLPAADAEPAAQTSSGPRLAVNAALSRHPISPDIYGVNYYALDAGLRSVYPVPVVRYGGDNTTNYNWLADSSNSGRDYYFLGGNGASNPVPGGQYDQMIRADRRGNGKSIVTIPIIGYVNKTSQWNCSYPASLYPNQQSYLTAPSGERCGNGLSVTGAPIQDTDPLLNYIQVDPEWMQRWVHHLVATHGDSARSKIIYQMDNEPFSWSNIHFDVHFQNTTYDEVVRHTIAYAAMIKRTDPTAPVLGPSPWGAPAYFAGNGSWTGEFPHGTPFVVWYLQQLRDYEQEHAVRLLDYFDLHYYPPTGNNGADDPTTNALRLRSTRALWDPSYTTEDWMGQYFTPAKQLFLIPRMRAWVADAYPGTQTAITEYNWGAPDSLSGALAQADVLGIFGREGLDLATMWGPPAATDPAALAFRIYRDYDGSGHAYGDTWVQATSQDQGQLAIYGAERTGRRGHGADALTLVVINKTTNPLPSTLQIASFRPDTRAAEIYQYSAADLKAIQRQADLPLHQQYHEAGEPLQTLDYRFPAASITLIVLPGHADVQGSRQPHDAAPGTPGTGIQTLPDQRAHDGTA